MSENITIAVRDILGCDHASIELTPGEVTEVVGPNAAGKTSIAVAAQAVLTMDANPIKLDATESRTAYIRDRADAPDDASARLSWEQQDEESGESSVACELVWRPNSQSITAPPWMTPMSSEHAAGLIDFRVRKPARKRAEDLQDPLLPHTEVVLSKLAERLKGYLHPDDIVGVLDMIREQDFDEAENTYRKRAIDAKRAWEKIAGRRYGSRVAADWRPEPWHADWDSITPQLADEQIVACRDMLSGLHQANAVSEVDAARAAEAEAHLPELRKKLANHAKSISVCDADEESLGVTNARTAVSNAANKVNQIARVIVSLDDADASIMACPHCGGPLLATVDGLVAHDAAVHAELLAQRAKERDDAQTAAERAEQRLAAIKEKLAPIRSHRGRIESAMNALRHQIGGLEADTRRGGPVLSAGQSAAILEAEQAVENAKATSKAVRAALDAKGQHETVVRYELVIEALGPQGVRAKLLEAGLAKLNKGLAVLAETARWPAMVVSDTGMVKVGGRPVMLASESEQWRAQAAMQLTLGALDKSRVVVLDRADVLDAANREGLVAALQRVAKSTRMAVLVCSTGTADPDAAWSQAVIGSGVIDPRT